MHGLHAENLVIALFVVEHGCGEVVEHIIGRERSICLFKRLIMMAARINTFRNNCEPGSIRAR